MNKIVFTMNYKRPYGAKLEYQSNDMVTYIQGFPIEDGENILALELIERMCEALNVKYELREEI